MAEIRKFNIRVYGLFINENKEILLADEARFDIDMTKFPGGGLHYGEGPIDCLKREMKEESGLNIEVLDHFYTTDFFQQALFFEDQQLISIYYLARLLEPHKLVLSEKPFDFNRALKEPISFRYRKIALLEPMELSFPIDRYVLGQLKEEYS